MFEIKKVKKLSVANIAALLYAFFGFVGSFIASVYSLVIFVHEKNLDQKLAMYILTNLGLGFLIALAAAVIAGIFGWLLGIIAAAFYNFIAKTISGIKVELADEAGQALTLKTEEKKSSFAKATEDKQELFKY
jgi:ABC-type Fe3+ transport system permease subunit